VARYRDIERRARAAVAEEMRAMQRDMARRTATRRRPAVRD
jgi:hypothetical protein